MTTTLQPGVFESKWGFHPCDHATFLKLKRLNWFAQLAKRLNAHHERWARKQPQNRFVKVTKKVDGMKYREWALDEKGNRIPWKEHLSVPVDLDYIEENYRRARYPVVTPAQVQPITRFCMSVIDADLAVCEKWYAEHKSEIR